MTGSKFLIRPGNLNFIYSKVHNIARWNNHWGGVGTGLRSRSRRYVATSRSQSPDFLFNAGEGESVEGESDDEAGEGVSEGGDVFEGGDDGNGVEGGDVADGDAAEDWKGDLATDEADIG